MQICLIFILVNKTWRLCNSEPVIRMHDLRFILKRQNSRTQVHINTSRHNPCSSAKSICFTLKINVSIQCRSMTSKSVVVMTTDWRWVWSEPRSKWYKVNGLLTAVKSLSNQYQGVYSPRTQVTTQTNQTLVVLTI